LGGWFCHAGGQRVSGFATVAQRSDAGAPLARWQVGPTLKAQVWFW